MGRESATRGAAQRPLRDEDGGELGAPADEGSWDGEPQLPDHPDGVPGAG